VLIVALAVAASVAAPSAASAVPQVVQAERMAVDRGAGTVVRDRSASGRRALVLVRRGAATTRVTASAPARLAVVARGTRCGGAPRLAVAVDGRTVVTRAITARRWAQTAVPGVLAAGRHRLTARLANPHRTRRCTRRLHLDRLVLTPAPSAGAARWIPAPDTTWQWQLTTPVDQSVDAQMFDIDLFENPASVVAELHGRQRRVVCYLDAGTFEPGRPDSAKFPAEVIGKELPDWPGERWLDVRRLDVLGPILEERLDLCRDKGFDAVEPDNVDAYANDSGFPLTPDDQLAFNRFLAAAAHARGLSVGLKNDLDQVAALEPDFDWALNEQCFQYQECGRLTPFARAGKAVFVVEYELTTDRFCADARTAGFMAMRKRSDLDAWREPCW
jgi:hypothetical protein